MFNSLFYMYMERVSAIKIYYCYYINSCLIFVKIMDPYTNYYIIDQSYLNYISRKTHLNSVL